MCIYRNETQVSLTNQQHFLSTNHAARHYLALGFQPVGFAYGTKGPTTKGWNELRVAAREIDHFFPPDQQTNIGLLTGEPSGNLLDVDLDAPEAVLVAPYLLPPTGMVHGREGKPASHWWYKVEQGQRSKQFKDQNPKPSGTAMLVELRGSGVQTTVPPSIHPCGEPIVWYKNDSPGQVKYEELLRAVQLVAAAALLARYWPSEGCRQDAALALSGGLLRGGFSEQKAEAFMEAVATAAGDEEAGMRVKTVGCTAQKLAAGEAVKGWPSLPEMVGEKVVQQVCGWLGVGRGPGGVLLAQGVGVPPGEQRGNKTGQDKKSNAERLLAAAQENGELFTTPEAVAYVHRTDDHRGETFKVQSAACKLWLVSLGRRLGIVPGSKALADTTLALEAAAFQNKSVRQVYLRFARLGHTLFVDLADDQGRVVEVTPTGWRVVTHCPVAFLRPPNLAPLPVPEPGGSLQDLRRFLNVTDEGFPLVRGFILDCFKGVGPYTVLLINGEQGSAKSTATKILRQVIDPVHKALARRLQRDEYELAIAAQKNAVLFFDNVSSLPQWLSDAIASLATGSGFAVRTLYSQDEETVYGNAVPVCFNGIPDFAESSDLLDRAIRVTLPRIPDDKRLSEDEFEPAFQAARPGILGAILDAVSAGLRNYDAVRLESLPRMARSARWIAACETALPEGQGSFAKAYEKNREELNALAIENNPVATALIAWMDQNEVRTGKKRPERNVEPGKPWEGSASALHNELLAVVNGLVATSTTFPKAPNKLSGELRRLAPALERAGVRVTQGRSRKGSKITVERFGPQGGSVEPASETLPFPAPPLPHRQAEAAGVFDVGGEREADEEGLRRYLSADYAGFAGLTHVAG
jgi:hypothetical protein